MSETAEMRLGNPIPEAHYIGSNDIDNIYIKLYYRIVFISVHRIR